MKNKLINDLIKLFSKLPSLGPRSAKRLVVYLLNNSDIMDMLISLTSETKNAIKKCPICGNLTTNNNSCEICGDSMRNNELCIVETITDMWALEDSGIYKGKYHILGGNLSASEGRTPSDLNINNLVKRIKNDDVKEVIIATNPTLEGQTTAFYLIDLLKDFDIKITQPALGIPLGSEFNYLDESTLDIAFKNKKDVK